MKKILTLAFCVLISVSVCLAVPASASGTDIIYGDVNSDGSVNPLDAIIFMRSLEGWEGYSIDKNAADVNLDKATNNKDSVILMRHLSSIKGYEALPYTGDIAYDGYIPGIW